MIDAVVRAEKRTLTWAEFVEALAQDGVRARPGDGGVIWLGHDRVAMSRMPPIVGAPTADELSRVLWRGRAAVASFLIEPDERHPANAFLYVCRDRAYSLASLKPKVRHDVRRATEALRIAPLGFDQLLAEGGTAFCDTRRRVGLSDGTVDELRRRFGRRARNPAHVALGAWKGRALAAFLSMTEVADYAEIDGTFTADEFRAQRPNCALLYHALRHYLVDRGAREVSYGLSSIQVESGADGLHHFKCKVGFSALPVHRAFVAHPLLRPFLGRATVSLVGAALRLRPRDPRLKKADGVLRSMIGEVAPLPTGEDDARG